MKPVRRRPSRTPGSAPGYVDPKRVRERRIRRAPPVVVPEPVAPSEGVRQAEKRAGEFSDDLFRFGRRLPWDKFLGPIDWIMDLVVPDTRPNFDELPGLPGKAPGGASPEQLNDPANYDWAGWEVSEFEPTLELPDSNEETEYAWADSRFYGGNLALAGAPSSVYSGLPPADAGDFWVQQWPGAHGEPAVVTGTEVYAGSLPALLETEPRVVSIGDPVWVETQTSTGWRASIVADPTTVYVWSDPSPAAMPAYTGPGGAPRTIWVPLTDFPYQQPARFGNPVTQPPGEVEVPWTHPDADTQTVPVPILQVPVYAFPAPETQADPSPQPDTQEIEVVDTGAPAITRVRVGRPTNRAVRRREPRNGRVKERKIRMQGVLLAAWHVINVVSEHLEFIDAMHKTLPKNLQAKGSNGRRHPTPYEKAEAVWNAFEDDRFDLAKGVVAFVNEQMEDYVYGRTSIDAQVNQLLNKPTGGGKFATQQQELLYDASGESPLPIPKLNFDVDTGDWSLDVGGYEVGGNLGRSPF